MNRSQVINCILSAREKLAEVLDATIAGVAVPEDVVEAILQADTILNIAHANATNVFASREWWLDEYDEAIRESIRESIREQIREQIQDGV